MKKNLIAGTLLASMALVGCSKSGGGSGNASAGGGIDESSSAAATAGHLTGTAAIGAPLGVANVMIKGFSGACAGTPLLGKTNSLGVYDIDVDNCTAPYFIKVSSSLGEVSTVATQPGIIANVTPLTQLIAQRAAGSSDLLNNFSSVNAQKLSDAQGEIKAVLKDYAVAVGASASVSEFNGKDLLSGSFAANGKGIDKLLDLIKIENSSGTNFNLKLGSIAIAIDVDSGASAATPPQSQDVATAAAEASEKAEKLDGARDFAKKLTAIFVNGAPSETQISQFVTNDYLHFGVTKAEQLAEFAEDKDIKGIEFRNVVILNDDENDFWVAYQIFGKEDGKYKLWNTWTTKIHDPQGTPKMMGNRLPFELHPTYIKISDLAGSTNIETVTYAKAFRLGGDTVDNYTLKAIADNTVNIKVTSGQLDTNSTYNSRRFHNYANQYVKISDTEASQTISKIVYDDNNSGGQTNLVSYVLMPSEGLQQSNPYLDLKLPTFNHSMGSCAWTKTALEAAVESDFGLLNQIDDDSFGSILMVGENDVARMQAWGEEDPIAKFNNMVTGFFKDYSSTPDFKLNFYYAGQYGTNDFRYDHFYRCD